MFGLRSVAKATARNARNFSSAGQPFREKTFKENWLSDSGSYPVLVCIAFALGLSATYLTSRTFFHVDTRIFATDRKALFRGELRNVSMDATTEGEESGHVSSHH